ncbi:unnamed protein product [Lepeophtheirus salmonis]|uniref:(salmon louse) hypothetical protein n=1 Tax=Lepeophtheirus salmonis TaxID=72036 RepID=A0A7R8H6A9_LEPSM|nr:cuticle protein 21-like [Lepeophtheirus salmonis]CAB4061926.1 unnamed protein product [Lepeophtheirus salmonis]CAF2893413.1 unnamed protein product [Lepeophtheirus salmonis]
MYPKISIPLLLLVALSASLVIGDDFRSGSYDTPANYNFNWNVQDDYSNNNFGQEETRNGDNTVGSYFVALPDGRIQRVTYTVDPYGGYQAQVTYEGEARYPTPAKQGGGRYN